MSELNSTANEPVAEPPVPQTETPASDKESEPVPDVAISDSRSVEVYLPPNETPKPVNDDDESIYEMTTVRVKAYQSLLTSKSRKLAEGRPMLTKELLRQQEAERKAKIEKCELRIRFPDQTQLLSTFNATETLGDVMTFVRFSLVDPMIPFYFFVTPPRRVLADPSKTLVNDLGFGSREILYFAWDMQKIQAQLGEGYEPPTQPLRPEVLKEAMDISRMRTFESEQRQREDEDSTSIKSKTLGGTGEAGRTLGGGPVPSGSRLIKPPAWMKLGRK
ncbi:hypothetical protein V1525DRAFT_417114 [Lipomyces kononenkoae]|uniref:Uncharacterized protein n=1 Tax=Lipomyces kononenkoae TaxID=34357 RepID=A0ACC3T7T9_LIPKO